MRDNRKQEKPQRVAPEISGVMIALGNKIAHDGAGEPADDVHGKRHRLRRIPGEQQPRDMIKRHGKDREQLECVAGKTAAGWEGSVCHEKPPDEKLVLQYCKECGRRCQLRALDVLARA